MAHISLITIGTELLKGRITNTNARDIGKMLRPKGFKLARTVMIPDDKQVIRHTVLAEMEAHDVVLISGGLGPTRDDMTKGVLLEILGNEWVLHQPTLTYLENRYKKKGRPFTERNREQAYLPDTCEVLPNPMGTAPGMLFDREGTWVISMPGVPFEMLYMMEHEVIPRLEANKQRGYFRREILRLSQIPESNAADRMEPIYPMLGPDVQVAYLPRIDGLWLELFVESESLPHKERLDEELDKAINLAEEVFQDKLYAKGSQSLPALIHRLFRTSGKTLAVAESITGGNIGAEIVMLSGASTFFKGSMCTYDTQMKIKLLEIDPVLIQRETVVSQAVAEEMAQKVRTKMGADIGLSTTGLAEAQDPSGPRVWIGFATAEKTVSSCVSLYGDRKTSIQRATQHALQFCLSQF